MGEINELDEEQAILKEQGHQNRRTNARARSKEKRYDIMDRIKNLTVRKQTDELTTKGKASKTTVDWALSTDIRIPTDIFGQLKLEEGKKDEFRRNVVIAKICKSAIKGLYKKIEAVINTPLSPRTEKERDEGEQYVKSIAETLKSLVLG